MTQEEREGTESIEGSDSRLLRCADCGDFYPATITTDGELVPVGGTRGNRCTSCEGDEFEQVVLDSTD
jgi:hypothetical protein